MLVVLCVILASGGGGPKIDNDIFDVMVTREDNHRVYHATVDMLSGGFHGMLENEKDYNVEKFDADRLTQSPFHELHGKLFSPEQPPIENLSEKIQSSMTVRSHPTEFGIRKENAIPSQSELDVQINAAVAEHGVGHLMSHAQKLSDEIRGKVANVTTKSAEIDVSHTPQRNTIGRSTDAHLLNLKGNVTIPPQAPAEMRVMHRDIGEAMMMKELTVTGVELFGEDVTQRTLRLVMEERHVQVIHDPHGRDIGAKSESTFFIMAILKLIISPFVCLIMMVVITPAEGGMKNAGGGAITEAAGGPLIEMLGKILGFIFGLILAYVMGNVISEACTFILTSQLTFIVCNNVFEQTAMDTANTLQGFFMNTLLPALQLEVVGYLVDVLSDALHSALHHTITRVLSTRLAKSLTPATLHYYYCIYCYYYGDYCDQCFHSSEHNILDQLTWTNFGS